jgi:hypothetical protein
VAVVPSINWTLIRPLAEILPLFGVAHTQLGLALWVPFQPSRYLGLQ